MEILLKADWGAYRANTIINVPEKAGKLLVRQGFGVVHVRPRREPSPVQRETEIETADAPPVERAVTKAKKTSKG